VSLAALSGLALNEGSVAVPLLAYGLIAVCMLLGLRLLDADVGLARRALASSDGSAAASEPVVLNVDHFLACSILASLACGCLAWALGRVIAARWRGLAAELPLTAVPIT